MHNHKRETSKHRQTAKRVEKGSAGLSNLLLIVFFSVSLLAGSGLPALGAEGETAGIEAEKSPGDAGAADYEELRRKLQELQEQVEKMQEEARARKRLEVTEEEKREEEQAILEAAGRRYYLLRKGMMELEYMLTYAYYSFDLLSATSIEHHSDHNFYNYVIAEYALRDNLTADVSVPFVYKYDDPGTGDSKDNTGIGDVSMGLKYQPFKSGGGWPSPIVYARITLPTSEGDYEINPEEELSTGSGLYSLSGGISVYHPFDPVSAFGSLDYEYRFTEDGLDQRRGSRMLEEVEPGDRISGALGFGYALSYRVSLTMSYSYTYELSSDYNWADGTSSDSGDIVYSSLHFSTNWRFSPERSVIVGAGIGLTDNDPDFTLTLRFPFQFDLD